MIQIFKDKTNFKFTNYFSVTSIASTVLVAGSIYLILTMMNYGVDFRGGAEVQVKFTDSISVGDARASLEKSGFEGVSVQRIGEESENEILVKLLAKEGDLNKVESKLESTLTTKFGAKNVDIRKVDIVGPKAGAELRLSGFQAMVYALIAIMIYIGLRFDFKYAPGAIFALFHDDYPLLSLVFLLLQVLNLPFRRLQHYLLLLGTLLMIRLLFMTEFGKTRRSMLGVPFQIISTGQLMILSRTILPLERHCLCLGAMFIYGGEAIHSFFFAITLGVLIGTYSSIFVAAPVTLLLINFLVTVLKMSLIKEQCLHIKILIKLSNL